ncbi:MAG: M23 family metallopeptidase [Clostridia bacterium]|nr:M23 family metallopeptidase [Clostridia bacterium]
MKTSTKKFTAFILAITLTLPFMVFAAAQDEKVTSDGPDIAYEMPEMRNEYEKHFLMSDGTAVATTYADPVNYYDISDNTWKEIDNTLTLKNGRYQNKGHGGFDVSFRGENDGGELVKITVDEHTLSWNVSVQNALGTKDTLKTQVSATVSRNQDSQNNKFAAKNAGASIKYNSPFSGNKLIDVNYTVSQYKVKEDITIYSPKDGNAIYYTYNCGELTAVLNPDNSIDFIDEAGNPIYTVHSPYMYDSAGNGSRSFRITLKQTDDICTVVMTPDKEWLNSADRVYPVVIDPTVTNNKAVSNYSDTYIHSGDTAGEHANETRMYIGKLNGVQHYSLIRFGTLPDVPANSEVLKAQFVFTLTPNSTTGGPFTAKLIATPWNEPTVCYNNRPRDGIVLDTNVPADFPNGTVTFDVTDYYIKTKNGTYPNYGIWIQNTDSSLNDYNVVYTSNCGDTAKFPSLILTYSIENETESNNSTSTADFLEMVAEPSIVTSVQGLISSTTDVDYFKITPPRHGRLEFTLSAVQCNHRIVVLTSDGTAVACKTTSDASLNGSQVIKHITFSFVNTKTSPLTDYYIKIKGIDDENTYSNYYLSIRYSNAYSLLGWEYPLEPFRPDSSKANIHATSPVGVRNSSYHKGLDISANSGELLYAVTDAYVAKVDYHYSDTGMGNYVVLWTGAVNKEDVVRDVSEKDPHTDLPFAIVYMHMSSVSVEKNTCVREGDLVGYAGNTGGLNYGSHLHLEIYVTNTMPTGTANNPHGDTTAPNRESIINPYAFYYDDIRFTGTPY